jgi:hypothetical protein
MALPAAMEDISIRRAGYEASGRFLASNDAAASLPLLVPVAATGRRSGSAEAYLCFPSIAEKIPTWLDGWSWAIKWT